MEVNYNITNNMDGIKNAITRKVMAKTVSKVTGNSEAINEVVGNILDVTYEEIKAAVDYSRDPIVSAALESYVDTIDNLMAEYVAKRRNSFIIATEAAKDEEEKKDDDETENLDAAFDDEVADDVMKNEGGDELSDVVSDIIESAIQGTREQMKQAVKLALKLEKDNQEEKYNTDKEDADEFDEMTPDDPEAEEAAEQAENGEGNPFDENKEEGENPEGTEGEGSDNPFNEGSEGGEQAEGGNPFDEPADEQPVEGEKQAAPAEGEAQPKESDGEKNGNPFESILDEVKKEEEVSMESMITNKLGLNPGELTNFINNISNKMLSKDMKTVFDTYGPESAEMNAARELYKTRSTEMAQGILNSIIVFESIGVPFNNNNIKYPDLFI
jgi:hypothetical protein